MTINLINTGAAFTLTQDVVIDITITALSGAGISGDGKFDASDFRSPSTSWGDTREIARTSTSITHRWTLYAGTTMPSNDEVDWSQAFIGVGRTASYVITPTVVSSYRLPDGRSMFQSPVQDSYNQGITSSICSFYRAI